ncbi:MAG TPA: AAA family ATPase [Bacillota bacterium]|nr:AAA family ATPase [Bacillota bacterium]
MIIRRLDLEGFGRFRGRTVDLAPGLSVLFGPNEAGKSTLHAFLDGMLFGFRQTRTQQGRQRRTRAYTLERERFRPWDGGSYAGALAYDHGGRSYLVRRDFARDSLQIQDALTGRDVSAEFELDPATGERDFARRHGGLTPVVFRNTLSVGQAAAALDRGALGPEIRRVLASAEGPEQGGAAAIEVLRGALEAIGTPRRSQTPLGQAEARAQALTAMRAQATAALELTRSLEDVRTRLDAASREAEAAQRARDRLERARMGNRLREARALTAEIEGLTPFATARLEDLAVRRQALAKAEQLETEETAAASTRAGELAVAEAAVPRLAGLSSDLLEKARSAWREGEDLLQRAAAVQARLGRLRELTALEHGALEQARRKQVDAAQVGVARIVAASGLGAALVALLLRSLPLALAGVLVAAVGVWRLAAARRAARDLAQLFAATGARDFGDLGRLDGERRALLGQPADDPEVLRAAATAAQSSAEAILAEFGVEPGDWDHLGRQAEAARRAEAGRQLAADRLRQQLVRADAATAQAAQARADLDSYLAAHHVASPEEFASRAEAAGRRASLQTRLEGLLAGGSLEDLAARFPEGPPPPDPAATDAAVDQAHAAWLAAMDSAQRLEREAADLRQRLGQEPPSLAEVEADLRRAGSERRLLQARQEGLALALRTIEDLQQGMQREFAPVLHRRLAELAPGLTGGRYRELHVDEDLNVTVRVPERADLVPAEQLSRGASDQLYLAARVALAEVATGGAQAPLLLDDSLAHFDDDRLAAALACLQALAADRQILLFTCHRRVLAAMGPSTAVVEV